LWFRAKHAPLEQAALQMLINLLVECPNGDGLSVGIKGDGLVGSD
jgi:hypothetical protein